MLFQDSFNVFPRDFFAQESAMVARALLGHQLLRRWPDGTYSRYRIVETEAYTQDDPACHAYGKSPARAGRSATLFKAPGMAYVYLIYGIYHCLNVVTEPEGRAGAVLFRALEPLAPFSPMQGSDVFCTRGPGKLCNALQITKADYNEKSMMSPDSDLLLVQATQPAL
ncbi:MAG: DNA-3-methyladenine glycosylase, partial [Vampirovibrionales bacterium]|nr:DNA-3-methyladenine glycosylase [Vampirovibrionales bacterium]